ncbi:MAG TPA: hypothetical protein VGW74_09400 [Propionibacteriaceae bacterium]|nr:hypothetical protein [Propionibacteriaceae bacterium]
MLDRLGQMLVGRLLGWFDEMPDPEGFSALVHWTSENAELTFAIAALVLMAWAVLRWLWQTFF